MNLSNLLRNPPFHALTCGGDRGDYAHLRYQAVHGGDAGELVMTETGLVCPVCGWEQPQDSPFNERYVLLTDEDLETKNWTEIIALCSIDTWSKLKNFHGYLKDEKRDDIYEFKFNLLTPKFLDVQHSKALCKIFNFNLDDLDAIWDEKDIESFPPIHVIAGPQDLFIEDFYEIE